MTRWMSFIDPSVGDGQNTINGIIDNGSTYGIGISDDLNITGLSTFSDIARFSNAIRLDGELRDGDNNFGSSGQVLSSDGTDTRWVNAAQLSAGAAAQIAINSDNSSNANRFITFVDSSSGNNNLKTASDLLWNPNTNVLTAPSFSGNLTGTIQTAAQTNITSLGTLSGLTVGGNIMPNSDSTRNIGSNSVRFEAGYFDSVFGSGSNLTDLNASNLSTGTVNTARLPNTYTKAAKITIQATGLTNDVHLDAADHIILEAGEEEFGAIYFRGNNGTSSYRFSKAGQTTHEGFLSFESLDADRTFTFPNVTGTVALTSSDITGNAASATILETSRNFSISGDITASAVSFNGNGNVSLSATIDTGVVDYDNLKASNRTSASNGQFLAKRSGNTGGMTWEDMPVITGGNLTGNTLASGIVNSSLTSLGTLTGLTVDGLTTINRGFTSDTGHHLFLRQTTNGEGATIKFSDQTAASQFGLFTYKHTDSHSNSAANSFHFDSSESSTAVIIDQTSGNSGYYVGTTKVDAFASGTKMIFHQSAAPTGWTKITSNTNQRALRVVSGNLSSGGGSHNFTTVFTSNRATSGASVSSHTLTTNQIPSHTHDTPNHTHTVSFDIGNTDLDHTHGAGNYNTDSQGNHNHEITDHSSQDSGDGFLGYQQVDGGSGDNNVNSSSNGAHTHDITGNSGSALGNHNHDVHNMSVGNANPTTHSEGGGQGHSHGFTDATVDLAVRYLDVIIAEKD